MLGTSALVSAGCHLVVQQLAHRVTDALILTHCSARTCAWMHEGCHFQRIMAGVHVHGCTSTCARLLLVDAHGCTSAHRGCAPGTCIWAWSARSLRA